MGVSLPAEVRRQYDIEVGDQVDISATKEGILLTKADAEYSECMALFHESVGRYGNAFRRLAK
ncbi:putative addiction module antidote [Magnetofaba australis IT-1]|uniref:Putative addiction module antidote n=1 Tax=Magnetofaba australis IT-1 TaxID=1434232 RepID=A0A1Y2K8H3_9PROT|nr:putative addiction module antidote [Magnetofaba australis IT-1]